jgi:hypothetical protein
MRESALVITEWRPPYIGLAMVSKEQQCQLRCTLRDVPVKDSQERVRLRNWDVPRTLRRHSRFELVSTPLADPCFARGTH